MSETSSHLRKPTVVPSPGPVLVLRGVGKMGVPPEPVGRLPQPLEGLGTGTPQDSWGIWVHTHLGRRGPRSTWGRGRGGRDTPDSGRGGEGVRPEWEGPGQREEGNPDPDMG